MRLSVLPLWWTWVLLATGSPAAAGAEQQLLRIESSLDAMGSVYTIVAYGEDRNALQAAVDLAFEEVKRLDDLLSNYKPRSEWSKVNREAGAGPVRVSPELFGLVEACLRYSQASEGAFDITVGPLVRTWGFFRGTGRLPHRAEIRTALGKVGYRKVLLDRADGLTIRFAQPGVEIDPGGIGKGYAVDRIAAILRERGIRRALISAGGSSMYGIGAPPDEERGWSVKIRHPRRPSESVSEVFLRDRSMATSGTSEKFFVSGGKLYSHIFDPRTGYPAQGMLSVSVLADKAIDSEAWTKPMFILGRPWASRRKQKDLQVFFCEDKTEIACAWLQ